MHEILPGATTSVATYAETIAEVARAFDVKSRALTHAPP
jgi:hypothetical protein